MSMKRLVSLALALVLTLSCFCFASAEVVKDFGGAELVVATWGWAETNLRKIAGDFETMYNCKLVVDPTAGNPARITKLMAEKDNPTADVAFLSTCFVPEAVANDLFDTIDTEIVTNVADAYDIALNPDGYGPCYSLCRYSIMYDAKALEEAGVPAPTSYVDLFDDQYAHMVILPDMTSTAMPYILVAMAEALGGSQEDVSAAMALMQEKKDNFDNWYVATSDVYQAFANGDACITVFMDIYMKDMIANGYDMVWVDAAEGTIAAPSAINVVKNCKNPELANLFIQYMLSLDVQNQISVVMGEAPSNKNAVICEDQAPYLVDATGLQSVKAFDDAFIATAKIDWIDTFQRTVAIQ